MTISERSSVTPHPSSRRCPSPPPTAGPASDSFDEHLQRVVRRALRAKPERARQKVGLKDRLEHDLHRSLHDSVTDRGNRQRPPLLGPRLRDEHPPGRDRTAPIAPAVRCQLVEQPGHPVLLDLGQGGLVDARRAVVAAHLRPTPATGRPCDGPCPAARGTVVRDRPWPPGTARAARHGPRSSDARPRSGGTSQIRHSPGHSLPDTARGRSSGPSLTGGCVVRPARPVLRPPPTPSRHADPLPGSTPVIGQPRSSAISAGAGPGRASPVPAVTI